MYSGKRRTRGSATVPGGFELGPRPVPAVGRNLRQPVVRIDLPNQVSHDFQTEHLAGLVARVDHPEHDDLVQRRVRLGGSGRLRRCRGRGQFNQRTRDLVRHEHALAVRVRAEDDGLLADPPVAARRRGIRGRRRRRCSRPRC